MNLNERIKRLCCRQCDWQRIYGPEEMLGHLRASGRFRRDACPDPDIVVELFLAGRINSIVRSMWQLGSRMQGDRRWFSMTGAMHESARSVRSRFPPKGWRYFPTRNVVHSAKTRQICIPKPNTAIIAEASCGCASQEPADWLLTRWYVLTVVRNNGSIAFRIGFADLPKVECQS